MRPLSRRSRQLPLAGEPMAVACGAVLFASPAKGRWGRRAAHGSVGSRFFDVSSNPSGSQANHLPLTGEAMTVPLGRGGDPSVSNPSGSQPLRFATPPVRNPSGSQANHLPLTGEAMTAPLDRGGDPSVSGADSSPWQGSQWQRLLAGEATSQSMRLFTAASIYSHTPRKFLFTSLFGMRRTVKP